MKDHPIIEQVRKARRSISAETGDTVEGLVEYYREREQTVYADRTFVGRRVKPKPKSGRGLTS